MKNQTSFKIGQLLLPGLSVLLSSGAALADCTVPISPADISNPTTVVGNGTPDSCTEDAFTKAIASAGIITFNCGPSPYNLTVTSEKTITQDTVIDGYNPIYNANLITLSGGNKTRILHVKGPAGFMDQTPVVKIQNLTFINGQTNDGDTVGGAAIYRDAGTLNVIDSKFFNNVGPLTGQDSAGGAIFSVGVGATTIVGSDFESNQASNGGAIGTLFGNMIIVNTQVSGNKATGHGGNPGNGGNGGGIYIDGIQDTVSLCGVQVNKNQANKFGGGLIRVTYTGGTTTIDQSTFQGNSIIEDGFAAGLYLQGTNVTLTNSTVINDQAPAIPSLKNLVVFSGTLSTNNDTINP